jgi:glycosyltransferase involved in cell wall biosynthesis
MRVLHVLGWYFPESLGGTEIYVREMVKRLLAAGHEASVASPDPGAITSREYQHDGATVFRFPIPRSPTRKEARGEETARGVRSLHDRFERLQPDIVHFHNLGIGLGLPELSAARLARARAFVTFHTSGLGYTCQRGTLMRNGEIVCDGVVDARRCAECVLRVRGAPPMLARGMSRLPRILADTLGRLPGPLGTALGMTHFIDANRARQRRVYELVERCVALTAAAQRILLANGAPPDKILINRLGVSHVPRVRHRQAIGRPLRIGYLGRFEALKGVDDLVAAAHGLPANIDIEVELCGPIEAARSAALLDSVEHDPRIRIVPAVSPDAVPERLASYDVLCCPSRCLEGGPTVALEALAVGTPVIGSRIGGLAEIVQDDGRLFGPGDRRALAALLQRMVEDPEGTVGRWRLDLPRVRSMDDVVADTLVMYGAA